MGSTASRDQQEDAHLYKAYRPCQLSSGNSCDACIRILELELQITQKQQQIFDIHHDLTLDEMLQQHRELRTEMNRIHNPTILQVPPEITSYIFELCMPPNSFHSSFDNFDLWKEPADVLVLGAVCREWRRIAWATPLLWTIILVRLDYPDLPWLSSFIRDWLSRSGGLPLSIHVGHSRRGGRASLYEVEPLIELVNQCSDRWCHLDLDVPTSFVSSFCGRFGGGQALQSLRIRPIGLNDGVPPKFKMVNTTLPSPTNVYLMFLGFNFVSIDWSRVTRVDITGFDLDECIQLFAEAPQLTHCSLSRVSTGWEIPLSDDSVTHLRLEELEFAYPTVNVSTFFNRFNFPALRKLCFNMDSEHLPTDVLSSLFHRSSCRLKELCIVNTNFTSIGLLSVLEKTPTLEILEISPLPGGPDRRFSSGALFRRLIGTAISTAGEDAFLPQLRSLTYHFGHVFSQTGNRLAIELPWDLIPHIFGPLSGSPSPRQRPLHMLDISFSRYAPDTPLVIIPEPSIPPLLAVLKAGSDLRIRYSNEELDLITASSQYHHMPRGVLRDGFNRK